MIKAEQNTEQFLTKYVSECYPKSGWDGLHSPNHYAVIRKIIEERPQFRQTLEALNMPDLPERVEKLIVDEFEMLFSSRRQKFIVSCLRKRLELFSQTVKI